MQKTGGSRRKTIGLLMDWASEYQMRIVFGAVDAAKKFDVNLVVVEGGCIESPLEYESQRNSLYQLVNPDNVDGLIVLSASINRHANPVQLKRFLDGFRPLPTVCISQEVEGYGLVGIDNTGLVKLVEHLVEYHHFRRFALVTGPKYNQDSEVRKATIQAILSRYGIVIDERLVARGDFSQPSGEKAAQMLLKQGKPDFDVVMAFNDGMAFGVLDTLQAAGIRVPQDVAVVGFDNLEVSAYSSPPLTTVNQSLYEQGMQAVELVMEIIQGTAKTDRRYPATRLMIRESCGCYSQATQVRMVEAKGCSETTMGEVFKRHKTTIVDAVFAKTNPIVAGRKDIDLKNIIRRILNGLQDAILDRQEHALLKLCGELFQETIALDESIFLWEDIISEIRINLLQFTGDVNVRTHIENLLHQLRIIVCEKAVERQRIIYNESIQSNLALNDINGELYQVDYSLERLMRVVGEKLPQMGFSAFYLDQYLFDENDPDLRQLLLVHNKMGPVSMDQKWTYSGKLAPDAYFADGMQHAVLVTLLQLSDRKFGLLGTEISLHNMVIYGELRRNLGSTLNIITSEKEKLQVSEEEHLRNLMETKRNMEEFIRTILLTVEMRDPYTAGHQSKVADIATAIAGKMGLSPEVIEGIRMAGIVHDLGKIFVPSEILNRPGRLNPVEFALIKEHPKAAYEILKNLKFPWPIARIILQHHERLDGSGYPYGLKGDAICLEAKIIAVADVVEAMAAHRPYRPALGIEAALMEIKKNQGVLFDPDVVRACIELYS
jgi:HD-GYP domain-containing protein (c-di-GMP phosphodiesterase class II)/DNA-binding LacI/PurR family transcriptional regulator